MKILISGTNTENRVTHVGFIMDMQMNPDISQLRKEMILERAANQMKEVLEWYFDENEILDATIMTDSEYDKMVKGD
jgi:hypothetical protein